MSSPALQWFLRDDTLHIAGPKSFINKARIKSLDEKNAKFDRESKSWTFPHASIHLQQRAQVLVNEINDFYQDNKKRKIAVTTPTTTTPVVLAINGGPTKKKQKKMTKDVDDQDEREEEQVIVIKVRSESKKQTVITSKPNPATVLVNEMCNLGLPFTRLTTSVERVQWVEGEATRLYRKYGLFDKGWRFMLGNAKRSAGTCNPGTKIIRISKHFIATRTKSDIMNTILHELGHMIHFDKYGRTKEHHGETWKQIHREMGGDGKRCCAAE